jgi:hypothetical protein
VVATLIVLLGLACSIDLHLAFKVKHLTHSRDHYRKVVSDMLEFADPYRPPTAYSAWGPVPVGLEREGWDPPGEAA